MARMLINCAPGEEKKTLADLAQGKLRLQTVHAAGDEEVLRAVRDQTIHLILRQSRGSLSADLEFARALRRQGFARPIVLLTANIGDVPVVEDAGLCIFETPFAPDALRGLVRKLLSNRSVPQQIFRRFGVNLMTTVETFISGDKLVTQMFNLSRGGAYVEVSARPDVRVGDLIRLRVWLDQLEVERTVTRRVVWLTGRGHAAGGYGLGLKFMKTGEALVRELAQT